MAAEARARGYGQSKGCGGGAVLAQSKGCSGAGGFGGAKGYGGAKGFAGCKGYDGADGWGGAKGFDGADAYGKGCSGGKGVDGADSWGDGYGKGFGKAKGCDGADSWGDGYGKGFGKAKGNDGADSWGAAKGAGWGPSGKGYGAAVGPAGPYGAAAGPAGGKGSGALKGGAAARAGGYGSGGAYAGADAGPSAGCKGGKYGKAGGGGFGPPALPFEKVQNKVHNAFYEAIWEAVEPVMHLETEWDQKEMCKRILKYFNKAPSAEMLTMPYEEATHRLIENAMNGYSAACGDKPWFFELDLSPALAKGAWEVVKGSGAYSRPSFKELEMTAVSCYEEMMDTILTDKAMYEVTQTNFSHVGEKTCNKINKALGTAHKPALEGALEFRGMPEQRVEHFMWHWMESSMGRAWGAVENQDEVLSAEAMTQLFQGLVAPFGDEHPFSCVPALLTQELGRPPSTWPFIDSAVQGIIAEWNAPKATKKRRSNKPRAANGDGSGAWGAPGDQAEEAPDLVAQILAAEAGEIGP